MRSLAAAAALALGLSALPVAARADDEDPDRGRAYVSIAFAGGAILPRARMDGQAEPGLDVVSRIGWTGTSGLGLVAVVRYAPLRRPEAPLVGPDGPPEEWESHLFVASAGPRFTLGQRTVRPWVSVGGGVVLERKIGYPEDGPRFESTTTVAGVQGSGGLELHLFSNGGFCLGGSWTRSVAARDGYDFFAVNAGLVFTL